MDLLHRDFTLSSVAMASGISQDNIRNWDRQHVMIGADQITGGGSPGRHRRYTFSNVVEIAVAGRMLRDTGPKDVKSAFAAAARFAHAGDERRLPGVPFHYERGETILFSGGGHTRILLTTDRTIPLRWMPVQETIASFTVMNLTEIFAQVCQAMSLDYREVLDEAYGEDKVITD